MPIRRFSPVFAMLLAACQSTTSGIDPESVTQPPLATFRCDGGATLKVESLGSSVNVTQDNGSTVSLPALPAGSRSRYSEGQTALVFNGREALLMITGKSPLECKR
jgi:membrane-bound inhibitor of C-type lysozyme